MVDKGYWVECFPVSGNDNVGDHIYTASIDVFPQLSCTGDSIDQAIDKLRLKLTSIKKSYEKNGVALPRAHSLTCPTSHHRNKKSWMSVYISLDEQAS